MTAVQIPPENESLVISATDAGAICIWDTGFVFHNVDGFCNGHTASVSKVSVNLRKIFLNPAFYVQHRQIFLFQLTCNTVIRVAMVFHVV